MFLTLNGVNIRLTSVPKTFQDLSAAVAHGLIEPNVWVRFEIDGRRMDEFDAVPKSCENAECEYICSQGNYRWVARWDLTE